MDLESTFLAYLPHLPLCWTPNYMLDLSWLPPTPKDLLFSSSNFQATVAFSCRVKILLAHSFTEQLFINYLLCLVRNSSPLQNIYTGNGRNGRNRQTQSKQISKQDGFSPHLFWGSEDKTGWCDKDWSRRDLELNLAGDKTCGLRSSLEQKAVLWRWGDTPFQKEKRAEPHSGHSTEEDVFRGWPLRKGENCKLWGQGCRQSRTMEPGVCAVLPKNTIWVVFSKMWEHMLCGEQIHFTPMIWASIGYLPRPVKSQWNNWVITFLPRLAYDVSCYFSLFLYFTSRNSKAFSMLAEHTHSDLG